MSRPTRYALGLSAVLPAVTLALLPRHTDAVLALAARGPVAEAATIAALLVVSMGGIGAVLAFVWLVSGAERSGLWRTGWVLALTLAGAAALPAFWWLYVRDPARLDHAAG